jgi:hypothetical protein
MGTPLVRKIGHVYLECSYEGSILFSKSGLTKMHRGIYHPSSEILLNLLKRARTDAQTRRQCSCCNRLRVPAKRVRNLGQNQFASKCRCQIWRILCSEMNYLLTSCLSTVRQFYMFLTLRRDSLLRHFLTHTTASLDKVSKEFGSHLLRHGSRYTLDTKTA